jgi:DNA-binding FadR family transcriptional regulator
MESGYERETFERMREMRNGAVAPLNLSMQVARELATRILSGRLAPQSLLPDETELTLELGVSRTVVREAIKTLAAKGLVEARPRLGTRVMPKREWQVLDKDLLAWRQGLPPDRHAMEQLAELRRVIEPAAAALAAERRTEVDLLNLGAAYAAMESAADDPERFVVADAGFHSAVLRATHNEYFDALESLIFASLLASIRITNPQSSSNQSSLPLHEAVLERIRAGEAAGAVAAMTALLRDSGERLSRAFPDAGRDDTSR